jgi:hypothetical protein
MSTAERRCPGCGAEAPRPDARFCEHCGAALAPLVAPVLPASAPEAADPLADAAARFERLRAHPDLEHLLTTAPDVPELAGRTLPSLLLLLLLALLAGGASLLLMPLCPPLGFVPLALVAVAVVTLGGTLIRGARTPLTAQAALVVALRAQLQAGAERSPAHTRHFAVLQDEHGTQSEHECFASSVAALAPGALGVAYLKGERLAAFVALDPG